MKKTLLSVVAIGAVGGAVAGLVFLGKSAGGSAKGAADLLPQETIFVAELPNVKASGERWKLTSLYKLGQEPEIKGFLERPLSLIPKNAEIDSLRNSCREIGTEQAFLALTSLANNEPKGVAGLRYSGGEQGRQALVNLLAKAKAQASKASPAGKLTLEQYNGYEIESFADADTTVAGAFAANWYFVANDVALLKETLDRLSGKADAPVLAANEDFLKTTSRLPVTSEVRGYLNFATIGEKIVGLMLMSGQQMEQEQIDEMRKTKGVAFASSFDGELIRDTAFVYAPGLKAVPKLNGSTDKLIAAATPIYAAFAIAWDQVVLPDASTIPGPVGAVLNRLHSEGINGKAFAEAFGSEGALSMDVGAMMGIPPNFVALEVKDRAAAEKIVRVMLEGWAKVEENGVTYWTSEPIPAGMLSLAGTVALNDKYLLLGGEFAGSGGAQIKAALARAEAGGETLTASANYKGALATVRPPVQGVSYVDGKTLFERVYGMLRPMAMMYGASAPQAAAYVDIAKLPATETISRHLHPMVVSQGQAEDGAFFESTGTVTLYQGAIGVGAIVGAAAQAAAPFLNAGGEAPKAGAVIDSDSRPEAPQASPDAETQETP